MLVALACALAYLIGSIPFAVLSSRAFGLSDPRSYGSGNPGATNVLRSGNKTAAALALLGDMAKGWLAVWLAQRYGLGDVACGFVALAAFYGHLFPIFLGFKGGKGVATAAGVLLALSPLLGVSALGVWIAVLFVFRYSSLAALCAAVASPVLVVLIHGAGPLLFFVMLIAVSLVFKHRQNFFRLLRGEESRVGAKPPAGAEAATGHDIVHGKRRKGRGRH
ncbi:MAG: glycerol-3-phosphate 1-O-acyltransferase PlsY [Betaproteobacteria bacterium]|nr:glycerol-3-phosphate 1-O-acyltransferase PlsY [Betaproteobacteria bacterium]